MDMQTRSKVLQANRRRCCGLRHNTDPKGRQAGRQARVCGGPGTNLPKPGSPAVAPSRGDDDTSPPLPCRRQLPGPAAAWEFESQGDGARAPRAGRGKCRWLPRVRWCLLQEMAPVLGRQGAQERGAWSCRRRVLPPFHPFPGSPAQPPRGGRAGWRAGIPANRPFCRGTPACCPSSFLGPSAATDARGLWPLAAGGPCFQPQGARCPPRPGGEALSPGSASFEGLESGSSTAGRVWHPAPSLD